MTQAALNAPYAEVTPLDWGIIDLKEEYHGSNEPQDAPENVLERISLTFGDFEMQDIAIKGKSRPPSREFEVESQTPLPSTSDKNILARILGKGGPRRKFKLGGLPYYGPDDPSTWPLHKTLFLTGHFFPPCWIAGVFLDVSDDFSGMFKWRCQVMAMITVIVVIALLILELGF